MFFYLFVHKKIKKLNWIKKNHLMLDITPPPMLALKVPMESSPVTKTKKRKRRRAKKHKPSDIKPPSVYSSPGDSSRSDLSAKLKDKMKSLRNQRTGENHRKIHSMREQLSGGRKNVNANALLTRLGITDPLVREKVMKGVRSDQSKHLAALMESLK